MPVQIICHQNSLQHLLAFKGVFSSEGIFVERVQPVIQKVVSEDESQGDGFGFEDNLEDESSETDGIDFTELDEALQSGLMDFLADRGITNDLGKWLAQTVVVALVLCDIISTKIPTT